MARKADQTGAYLACRTLRHSWDLHAPIGRGRKRMTKVLVLRCDRCGTERHDLVSVTDDVVGREYRYPDGYRTAGEATSMADKRLALIKFLGRSDTLPAGKE